MVVHILKIRTFFLCTFHEYFLIFRGVELRHIPDGKCLDGVWVVQSVTQIVFIPLYSNVSYALVYKKDFRILNKELRRAFKLDPLSS